ncbi:MAG: hypothetical protein ABFD76_15435 [Smithella sp.]
MTTFPTCGQQIDDGWKEYRCQCQAGISVPKADPNAEKKIEAWKSKHKCGRTK